MNENEKPEKRFDTQKVESSSEVVSKDDDFMLPGLPREILSQEEDIWSRINELQVASESFDRNRELANQYLELAAHFDALNVNQAEVKFLKEAYALSPSPELEHRIARASGFSSGFDFFRRYAELDAAHGDTKLFLEYCYFLERRGHHVAALKEFERRFVSEGPFDEADKQVVDGFLDLISLDGSMDSHKRVSAYHEILNIKTPGAFALSVIEETKDISQTIIGKETAEFEKEYGLEDEVAEFVSYFKFVARNYLLHALLSVGSIALFLPAFLSLTDGPLTLFGNILFSVIALILSFRLISLARARSSTSLVARKEIMNFVLYTPLVVFALSFAGGYFFGDSNYFIGKYVILFYQLAFFVSIALKGYSLLGSLRSFVSSQSSALSSALRKASLSREIASVVRGSSLFTIIINGLIVYNVYRDLNQTGVIIWLTKLAFLFLSWRWGVLSYEKRKMRARDQIVLLAIILFVSRAVYLSYLQWDMYEILTFLNFDAVIVIAIFMATCAERFVVSRISVMLVAAVSIFIYVFPALPGGVGDSVSKIIFSGRPTEIGAFLISVNLLLCFLVLIFVLSRWTFGSAKFGILEDGEMPRRKVGGTDLIVVVLVSVLIFGLLAGLVLAGGLLPVINLYVILFALLLVLGFFIPFLLAFLGIIDQNIWMRAFRETSSKMGLFKVPRRGSDSGSEDDIK